jgi:hypothetical protein
MKRSTLTRNSHAILAYPGENQLEVGYG